MNSISWFLYIAGVTENVGVALCTISVFCFIVCGVCWFGFSLADDDDTTAMLKRTGSRTPVLGAILLGIACLIPSKTTMYAIAASQVGETVANSPEAREMIDDTKQILRDYLKSLKKETTK
jgi:hypothetical protein